MSNEPDFSLQRGMVDSHFHYLHMENRGLPAETILGECFRQGLSMALEIGIVPKNFKRRNNLAQSFPGLYLASGLYPSECENPDWPELVPVLEAHLRESPKAAALGEIGLDYFHAYGTPVAQRELMEAQLDLANRLELPVIIHSRDAEKDILDILTGNPAEKGGIMHCFSSSREWTAPFLDLGFYISFAGNLTYKNSGFLREAAAKVPKERLLVETDAPYLSPHPVRGRLNHPGHIGYTYAVLAETTGIPLRDLIDRVESNFTGFLSLTGNKKEQP